MRVLVMGAGGVGGYYGAVLANHGFDVTFVARGKHLEALQQRGLELRSQGKVVHLQPVKAVGLPAEAGSNVDLVLFTVKTYDTVSALEVLGPAVGPATAILTLQNGIDSVDQIAAVFGVDRVLAGVTFVASAVVEPGIVQENGFSRKMIFGEPRGGRSDRVDRVAQALREAGIDVETTEDARRTIWEKFVLLAPHASVSSACQLPVGDIFRVPEAVALYRALIDEVLAIARASEVTLSPDLRERIIAQLQGAPPTQMSSMQRDYQAQRRVELEYLTGAVIRRARALGIPTPHFDALYAVLKTRAIAFGGLA